MSTLLRLLLIAIAVLALCVGTRAQNPPTAAARATAGVVTAATATEHPPLPGQPSHYWLVPESSMSRAKGVQTLDPDAAGARFARGVALVDAGNFAGGLPLLQNTDLTSSVLAPYAQYYLGRALLGVQQLDEADKAFRSIDDDVEGYLSEAVPLRRAELALARQDPEEAADILDDLSDEETLTVPEEVFLRLGAALEAAGSRDEAVKAYERVYYEFPLSTQAEEARRGIERILGPVATIAPDHIRLELDRADRLFAGRRWADAREAFAALARVVAKEDATRVCLRLAECDYYLARYRGSRDALRSYLQGGPHEAEARYFHLSATRALGAHTTYLRLARGLAADFPESSWAEETLNGLALHYIGQDDEAAADRVFRELIRRFPRGRYTDRAAWKVGWRAYKQERLAEAADTFESAAATFPRADFRPSWLYWAARARDQRGERAAANALYRIVVADYQNSYYGRLASRLLADRNVTPVQGVAVARDPRTGQPGPGPLVRNDAVIRALLAVDLYGPALNEVEYARKAWGDSVPLQATVAWIRHRRGFEDNAADRFADVRGGITLMRRAYPQFMAAGGEQLPPEVLRVIFPLDYWPLIKKHADAHRLDPYLMTALIAQESTFTADVRSSANAVGLMQLIPSTGRRYAGKVGIPYTSTTLTRPEANIRLGMRYFKDLMDRFGGAHFALAGYNAGENRVVRWIAERPGFDQDEFIDDIPFPETQNYVKRILGTADDYRRLYGGGVLDTAPLRR